MWFAMSEAHRCSTFKLINPASELLKLGFVHNAVVGYTAPMDEHGSTAYTTAPLVSGARIVHLPDSQYAAAVPATRSCV